MRRNTYLSAAGAAIDAMKLRFWLRGEKRYREGGGNVSSLFEAQFMRCESCGAKWSDVMSMEIERNEEEKICQQIATQKPSSRQAAD